MTSENRHFDCLRNKLPENFTNKNATAYYNRCFWEKCKCEYGTFSKCKEHADKWDPCGDCDNKWIKGCNPCSKYYSRPSKYYYTYTTKDCKNCGNCGKCGDCKPCSKPCYKPCCKPCYRPKPCQPKCDDDCGECRDVVIKYKPCFDIGECDNIVEFRIPTNGSKERYLNKYFDDEFIHANRFQCATLPVYNCCPSNLIDNMREEEFTPSDQSALVARGVKNAAMASTHIDRVRHCHTIPMNVIGRTSYYYFGDETRGSTQTGLAKQELVNGYFDDCDC